jgi:hypothetical protein
MAITKLAGMLIPTAGKFANAEKTCEVLKKIIALGCCNIMNHKPIAPVFA